MAISRYGFGNPTLEALLRGTKQVESSGNYGALGPVTKSGDRAYGAYQVMGNNIPSWTQAALGVRMTPEQFLANKDAQDLVARSQFAANLSKYGNPNDAISTWFTGRPVAKAGNASDGYNTNDAYINKVIAAAGPEARSWMASAAPQGATGAPMALPGAVGAEGAQGGQQGAQSISLGDQENQQPLNNIGSTLANMGASIASLDRGGTGIASLNASRVASNLAAQEQAREKDNGWKYQGQTDNKQGFVFSNGKEMKVVPVDPQFAGQEQTQMEKDHNAALANPALMPAYNSKYGIKTPIGEGTIKTIGEQVLAGNYKALTRLGEENRVAVWDYIGKKEHDLGLPSGYILQSEAEQEARKTAEREYGRLDARRNTAANTFLAGASTLVDLSEKLPRDNYKLVNEVLNMTKEQAQDRGYAELHAAVNTAVNEYANAITTSASGATVSDKNHARELLSTAQNHEALKGALQTMVQEVVRSKENIYMSNENRRARAKGQEVPYPQLEGEGPGGAGVPKALEEKLKPKEAASKKPKEPSGLPEVGKKATINGVEIERLE